MVRRGWLGESYRHALSARGIKTSRRRKVKRTRSKAQKKHLLFKGNKMFFAEKKQGIVDALTEQPDGQKMLKERQEAQIVGGAQDKVMKAVEDGKIHSGDANIIMRDVDNEAQMFRTATSGQMDYEIFKDNVDRIVKNGIRTNSKSLDAFDFDKTREEREVIRW